jgi:drug/metabolite transporter (DMT)-like permease
LDSFVSPSPGLKSIIISSPSKRANILVGYSCAILAAAFFGSVSTISKPVLSTVNPVLLSALVYIISGLTFTPIAQNTERSTVSKKYYYLVLVTASIGAAAAPTMFFIGLNLTTAADTALLSNGETVFSILFALLLFKEKLKRIGYGAVALILVGVFIVTTNFHFDSNIMHFDLGNIFIIAATALWGLDNNISKIITRHMQISRLVQLKSLIGGGRSLLAVLLIGIPFSIQQSQIIPIILVGVFGFAISLYLYLQAIRRIGVVKASSLLSLSAVFGLIFAAVLLYEPIGIYQLIAVMIMITGVNLMYKNEPNVEIRS